ncbi:MAG TPA: DUF2314 domain-containing protein [Allosphingosinicella sp.]|jgi:uncharacterized protein YegJ (DUF2314 family)
MIDILAALALALAPTTAAAEAPPAGGKSQDDGGIIGVPSDDAEMNAAIARGRAGLQGFYRRLASPRAGDSEFMVKFDIDPTDGVEFVWAADLDPSARPMTGTLLNQPIQAGGRRGDRVSIPEDAVIDWSYRVGRVTQGSFTNRVLLGRLPAADAASYREYLGW